LGVVQQQHYTKKRASTFAFLYILNFQLNEGKTLNNIKASKTKG
jgi:hypothetical protein